jgi:predicted RNA methylase
MRYPDHATYRALYAAYFRRDPAEMADLTHVRKGDTVIDFCCGGGRLADALLARGAKVICVDSEPMMIPDHLRWRHDVQVIKPSV